MKNIALVLITLFIFFLPQLGKSQIALEIKYGPIYGQPRELDQYTEFVTLTSNSDGKFLENQYMYGLAVKYFFNNRFYTGIQFDKYNIETKRISKIVFNDSEIVQTELYYKGIVVRERINSSILLGHHILYGFYIEAGASYMYNVRNILDSIEYDKSSNYAGFAGLGFRYRKNGFYFMVDYKYFIEEPTSFSEDSNFELGYNTQSFTIGLGYFFGEKNKE